jgi:hypothetical protein
MQQFKQIISFDATVLGLHLPNFSFCQVASYNCFKSSLLLLCGCVPATPHNTMFTLVLPTTCYVPCAACSVLPHTLAVHQICRWEVILSVHLYASSLT